MALAVTAAASNTPTVANVVIICKSALSSCQCIASASSTTSGGNSTGKIRSFDNWVPSWIGDNAMPTPATTSPTVYGRPSQRVIIAAIAATNSSKPNCVMLNDMATGLFRGGRDLQIE